VRYKGGEVPAGWVDWHLQIALAQVELSEHCHHCVVSSSEVGKGYLSGITALLTKHRSMQIRIPPDFFFAMTKFKIQQH